MGVVDADLRDYEVRLVDPRNGQTLATGAPADDVAKQLATFETAMRTSVATLDSAIVAGTKPTEDDQVLAVIELAAVAHGEWVRIHPFANGNGRVGRVWANWVAVRYGLPPFVRNKPRPDGLLYACAARLDMGAEPGGSPNHSLTGQVFLDLLGSRPARGHRT